MNQILVGVNLIVPVLNGRTERQLRSQDLATLAFSVNPYLVHLSVQLIYHLLQKRRCWVTTKLD